VARFFDEVGAALLARLDRALPLMAKLEHELEHDVRQLRARRIPSVLGPRAQHEDAAFVHRATGLPITHDVWVILAAARSAQDAREAAASQVQPEPVAEAARALVGDDPDVHVARAWLERRAALRAAELPPVDGLTDAAARVASYLRTHHPRCGPWRAVTAAVLSDQGWTELGTGTRRQRADNVGKRLTRTRET
jgi:hypothetical protein